MTHKEIIIKGPRQIESIRKASKLAANTLKMIEEYIRPGISTEELDHLCNLYIRRNGGKSACLGYHHYPKYTCISLNDTICHGIPSKGEILKEGDILNIDITVIFDGYFGDTSRMYTVGKVDHKAKTLVDVTEKCLEIGIKQVKPGNKTGNIGYEISKYAEARGFSVVREYTGHGIGVHFHEEPYIFHKSNKNTGVTIKPGMIFTIEPMINCGDYKTKTLGDGWTVKTLDGSLSAQFEHTILVTEKGHEILTLPD